MVETTTISLSIPTTLFNRADVLAQHLNISRDHLFELAIENFVENAQLDINKPTLNQPEPTEQTGSQVGEKQLVINQGDIYWIALDDEDGSESRIPHPHVIIQDNLFNHSRIHTVVACALTSNIKRASIPGNLLLETGEAHLPRQSVVEVSKVSTVDKSQLGSYIGSLSEQRIKQILAGMRFLQTSFFDR